MHLRLSGDNTVFSAVSTAVGGVGLGQRSVHDTAGQAMANAGRLPIEGISTRICASEFNKLIRYIIQ